MTKSDYERKFRPKFPEFQVFGNLLEFESLDFLYFAYYEAWYLTDNSG